MYTESNQFSFLCGLGIKQLATRLGIGFQNKKPNPVNSNANTQYYRAAFKFFCKQKTFVEAMKRCDVYSLFQ